MSALAKPHVHPTTTINASGATVNLEDAVSIDDVTALKATGTSVGQDKFYIVFSMRADNNPASVTWKYADATTRDTALAAIKTLASTAI